MTAANCIDWNTPVKRGEHAVFLNSQPQEINVCNLGMSDERTGFCDVQYAQIFRPKLVTR